MLTINNRADDPKKRKVVEQQNIDSYQMTGKVGSKHKEGVKQLKSSERKVRNYIKKLDAFRLSGI